MGFECLYKYKYIDKYYLYIVFQRYVLAHTIITKRSWLAAHTIVLLLSLTSLMPSIPPSISLFQGPLSTLCYSAKQRFISPYPSPH